MHKLYFLLFLIIISISSLRGQDLEYLPPVLNPGINKDTSTCLILGTIDYAKFDRKNEPKPYLNSMQIIDANDPWPPRWYIGTPFYSQAMFEQDSIHRQLRFYHIGYARLNKVNEGLLSFLYLAPDRQINADGSVNFKFQPRFVVLNKDMYAIDTVDTWFFNGGPFGKGYKSDPKVQRIFTVEKDSTLDLRKISGHPADSTVESKFWTIEVKDFKDSVTLSWNPLFHIPPSAMELVEKLKERASPQTDQIRWRKINTATFDYDGDILYAAEFGIGKISKKDGHIIWHIDRTGMASLSAKDNLQTYKTSHFFLQDYNNITATYTYFERGVDSLCPFRGVIFDLDKKSMKIKDIKYIAPKHQYRPVEHGGFEYNVSTGGYALDYGIFDDEDSSYSFRDAMDYYNGDNGESAVYRLPKYNYSFGFAILDHWPKPPRPEIQKKGALLVAAGDMKTWTWYKLEGPDNLTITKVGSGPRLIPQKGATYCVAGPYGVGYSVSKPFKVVTP